MIKFYRIFLLFLIFIILSTFNSKKLNLDNKKNFEIFQIKNIEVKNNSLIKNTEIINKLEHLYKKNIFLINNNDIKVPLKTTNFLKKIEVKKKYPNTILIKVTETKPIAFLYKGNKKYIIDSSSNLIIFKDNIRSENLPEIFGNNAENNFILFFNQLSKNNFPLNKIKTYYYFQTNRWDLRLVNNKLIKLPFNNINGAIIKSIELLNRQDFKKYNTIDLRVSDKIIVE